MTEIPNFPEDLLHLHHAWHRPADHPELPSRLIPFGQPGSGREFLTFHRDFMRKFHVWYDKQPFADQKAVADEGDVVVERQRREQRLFTR